MRIAFSVRSPHARGQGFACGVLHVLFSGPAATLTSTAFSQHAEYPPGLCQRLGEVAAAYGDGGLPSSSPPSLSSSHSRSSSASCSSTSPTFKFPKASQKHYGNTGLSLPPSSGWRWQKRKGLSKLCVACKRSSEYDSHHHARGGSVSMNQDIVLCNGIGFQGSTSSALVQNERVTHGKDALDIRLSNFWEAMESGLKERVAGAAAADIAENAHQCDGSLCSSSSSVCRDREGEEARHVLLAVDWTAVLRNAGGVAVALLFAGGCFLFTPQKSLALARSRGRGHGHRPTSGETAMVVMAGTGLNAEGRRGIQLVSRKKAEIANRLDLAALGEKAILMTEPLRQLIALKPDDIGPRLLLGQAQVNYGDYQGARKTYESILELDPYQPIALQGVAALMTELGEGSLVLDMLEKVVQQAEENSRSKDVTNLKMLLGQVHTVQGNMEAAMQLYNEIIEQDAKDFRPHLSKGLIYSIMGQVDKADKAFRKFRELCPEDFPHRKVMMELIQRAKREAESVESSSGGKWASAKDAK
ncbi:hypothetical protein CBR_g28648 [Chara braunii]|uniref:Uncharacterized protein n=1 Tax=Chara braunii TaxID=69332 RepID=A0A388L9M6_CHABU|nr:hypothetical protein CBR_g28648 [Chara braunii]|eukprot:GBG78932.1 hypothetical protein CBR_g28648 [Chara braunii]